MGIDLSISRATQSKVTALLVASSMTLNAHADITNTIVGTDLNALFGGNENVSGILSGNRGTNGGGDQSQQGGDMLSGTSAADLMIGALGVDVMFGDNGNDIMIGGTEDFNPFNRDRAFGGNGDDVFLWAPGDGNDFFDGGDGLDVVMLGRIAEQRGNDGNETGEAFLNVSPPTTNGSQDFDGIFIDPSSGLPGIAIDGGPGFCEVVDGSSSTEEADELAALDLDHLIRFVLRGPANDTSNPDTGLRIALHIKNTEYMVCGGAEATDTVVLDLTTNPPTPLDVSELPPLAFNIIIPGILPESAPR